MRLETPRRREKYTSPSRAAVKGIESGKFYIVRNQNLPTLVKALTTSIGQLYEGSSKKCRPLYLDKKSRVVYTQSPQTVPATVELQWEVVIRGPFELSRDRLPSHLTKWFQ